MFLNTRETRAKNQTACFVCQMDCIGSSAITTSIADSLSTSGQLGAGWELQCSVSCTATLGTLCRDTYNTVEQNSTHHIDLTYTAAEILQVPHEFLRCTLKIFMM